MHQDKRTTTSAAVRGDITGTPKLPQRRTKVKKISHAHNQLARFLSGRFGSRGVRIQWDTAPAGNCFSGNVLFNLPVGVGLMADELGIDKATRTASHWPFDG